MSEFIQNQSGKYPADWMYTTFELVRDTDETGVSGTGIVASGIIWRDGKCAMHWHTDHTSTTVYDSLESLVAIHGHGGKTRVVITGCGVHAQQCLHMDLAECGVPSALFEGREPVGVRSPMLLAIYRHEFLRWVDSNEYWRGEIHEGGIRYQWDGMWFRQCA